VPDVRLAGVTRRYGDVVAVDGVDLEVGRGEFFTMLGPSGSGKTTTLRMIAGFDVPDEGRVEIGGEDVTGLPAYDRPVNTVFQDYALFPHMTVSENVEYGLRVAKVDKAERSKRAKEALEMIQLGDLGGRKPAALSGGQRPRVLLLDEPLGALDLKLREQMLVELKSIQGEVGITFIYVTHDQEEALTMSDRVAVFNDGRIEQVGTPDEVYERPANPFVAGFVGTSNPIERDGKSFTVRPEKVRILDGAAADGLHTERGRVADVAYAGPLTRFHIDLEKGGRLQAVRQNIDSSPGDDLERKGQDITVGWLPEHTVAVAAAAELGTGSGTESQNKEEEN
jgi:putative spermidine/putrescine transport system ATP-binding protein